MAAKRTKKTVVSGVTREQYEQAFAEFAMADAKAQSLTAKMDQEMTNLGSRDQPLQRVSSWLYQND